jgi:hypothetical protein
MEVGSSGGMLILKLEKDFAKDSIWVRLHNAECWPSTVILPLCWMENRLLYERQSIAIISDIIIMNIANN